MSLMEKTGSSVGRYAPDFELPGIDEQVHHLSRYLETWRVIGVIFLSNRCPYVSSYLESLKQIQSQFQSQGLTLVGINANDAQQIPEESFDNMKQFAQEQQLNFPYLWDSTQDVAQSFGAQKTPEVFLIDSEGIIRYRGQIDNNPHERENVSEFYLQNAITAVLSSQEVHPKSTEPIGCPIQWRR